MTGRGRRALATFIASVSCSLSCMAAPATFPNLPSIYTHYSADNPGNGVLDPLDQAFNPEAVDVSGSKLNLPDLGFSALTYPKGLGSGTPVYFSTSGQLPAPLKPDVPYFLIPATGGGYQVYALANDEDAGISPGGVVGEKVLRAQNAAQGVGWVKFSDRGVGTHQIHSKRLLNRLTDWTGNGLDSYARSDSNKHCMLELDRDDAGHDFIRTVGAQTRENWVGSYSGYGPMFMQGPAEKRYPARKMVEAKRVVYQVFVCRVRSFHERQVVKFMAKPDDVHVQTDQIAYAGDHRMINRINHGDLIQAKTYEDGTLPAPLREGVEYFAHKVDTKNLTLHVSRQDAVTGINPIDLTDAGRGTFLFWAPERVGDGRRWSFFTEVLAPDSGGNTLSVRLDERVRNGLLKNESAFAVSGNENGEVKGLGTLPDLMPVSLWAPPGARLPEPLQPGVRYWVTKSPSSSSSVRLHASLDDAKSSVGKPTVDAAVIRFDAPGSGESLVSYDDDASTIAYGTLMRGLDPFQTRIPLGALCVFVFKIDFNDPGKDSAFATLGINQAFTEGKLFDIPKGPTPLALKEPYPAWTLFNSAQGHVPIDLDLYEAVYGSSDQEIPDSDIAKLVDYFKQKYGIEGPIAGGG